MNITENAIEKLKSLVKPDSGLAEGIRIFQGNGCCGPAIKMNVIKQPYSDDIKEVHEGINVYLDNQFAEHQKDLTIDFSNDYFQITGVKQFQKSGCC